MTEYKCRFNECHIQKCVNVLELEIILESLEFQISSIGHILNEFNNRFASMNVLQNLSKDLYLKMIVQQRSITPNTNMFYVERSTESKVLNLLLIKKDMIDSFHKIIQSIRKLYEQSFEEENFNKMLIKSLKDFVMNELTFYNHLRFHVLVFEKTIPNLICSNTQTEKEQKDGSLSQFAFQVKCVLNTFSMKNETLLKFVDKNKTKITENLLKDIEEHLKLENESQNQDFVEYQRTLCHFPNHCNWINYNNSFLRLECVKLAIKLKSL